MAESDWTAEYDRLWERLVPPRGQAVSVQGELIRCIGKVTDEAYRNGNINWDEGHAFMCRFVADTLDDPDTFEPEELVRIQAAVSAILDYEYPDTSGHGGPHYFLTEQAVRWCKSHPDLIPRAANPALKR